MRNKLMKHKTTFSWGTPKSSNCINVWLYDDFRVGSCQIFRWWIYGLGQPEMLADSERCLTDTEIGMPQKWWGRGAATSRSNMQQTYNKHTVTYNTIQ
jgi:hypothetical protein